jgi:menaquinol-cytochrome c reductase iron-sulfur subunit
MAEVDHTRGGRGRRRFLGLLGLAAAGLAVVGAAVPVFAYFLRPARRTPPVWRDVGAVDDFVLGETSKVVYPDPDPDPWEGLAVRNAAWVRREGADRFIAFSIYCTHTGCPVNWVHDARLFLCPCHGGIFDQQGGVTSGPPPRPLDRTPIRVRDGRVELRTAPVPVHS